jgi:hypothetical protein
VDTLIRTAMHHWSGAEAQDFHQWWVGQHRPRLVAAAQGLHGASANVRQQVAEQEHASGGAGGHAGAGAGSQGQRPSGPSVVDGFEGWSAVAGLVHGGYDALRLAGSESAVFKGAGTTLSGIGLGFAAVELVEGVRDRDLGEGLMGSIGIGGTAVGVVGGAAAAPLALGIGAFGALAEYSIPIGPDAQDSLLDYQARRMFGRPPDQLTPSQSTALTDHYSGAMGPLWMISDKMDQSSDAIGNAVGGAFTSVKRGISGWFR